MRISGGWLDRLREAILWLNRNDWKPFHAAIKLIRQAERWHDLENQKVRSVGIQLIRPQLPRLIFDVRPAQNLAERTLRHVVQPKRREILHCINPEDFDPEVAVMVNGTGRLRLVSLAARMVLGPGTRSAAFTMVTVALVFQLVGDALYGFGSSAHVTLQVARHWGCTVYVSTRDEAHRRLARALGSYLLSRG